MKRRGDLAGGATKRTLPEFPVRFAELDRIYFRLQSYHAFLLLRKHVVTTFEVMSAGVAKAVGRPLEHVDVARIVALLPHDVEFRYVHESSVFELSVRYDKQRGFDMKETDMFELKDDARDRYILVVDFTDGKLKQAATQAPSAVGHAPPTYDPALIRRLIAKRENKFRLRLQAFLDKHGEGAWDVLNTMAAVRLPTTPEYVDPVQAMAERGDVPASTQLRPPIAALVESLPAASFYNKQIVEGGHIVIPPLEPLYGTLDSTLLPAIAAALESTKGISTFYSHQADAINAVHEGHNVIVSTLTALGKSLIYQLPVLQALEQDPHATALYIFPTKALAQDQRRLFQELISAVPELAHHVVATYDGDTPQEERKDIRAKALVVFTNPDMLHSAILPAHAFWQRFLDRLCYVVVDELHMYRGVFGLHVAMVMRRMSRVCHMYGNDRVRFVLCSATLRLPVEHMVTVCGVDRDLVVHVDNDGLPSGEKHLVVWNPPPLEDLLGRKLFIAELAHALVHLMQNNVRTIAFCVVRRVCELLMKEVRLLLKHLDTPDLADQVMAYRLGYAALDRRQIEAELFKGNLKAVIATNALELGIDIGGLDAVLVCGFPTLTASFRQQSGRAGRRSKDSLTWVVGANDPVNQHYMRHPQELVAEACQDLAIDLDNLLVVESHAQCAAFELPLKEEDERWFGALMLKVLGRLNHDHYGYHPHGRYMPWPPQLVNIRAMDEEMFAVVDTTNNRNVVIEQVEALRTAFTLYEGGIFIHQGFPYIVREFNAEDHYAKIERVEVDWVTKQRDYTDVDPVRIEAVRLLRVASDVPVYFGAVRQTLVVFGFFKTDKHNRILDAVEVHNPPVVTNLRGLWIDLSRECLDMLREKHLLLAGAIHAAEHAIMSILPLFVFSSPLELGTECKAPEKEFALRETARKRPARLVFRDAHGGKFGSGLCAKAFENIDEVLQQALVRVAECLCDYGCPECVAAPNCTELLLVLLKGGALVVLYMILGQREDARNVEDGPEPNMPDLKIETCVAVNGMVPMADEVEIIEVKAGGGLSKTVVKQEADTAL